MGLTEEQLLVRMFRNDLWVQARRLEGSSRKGERRMGLVLEALGNVVADIVDGKINPEVDPIGDVSKAVIRAVEHYWMAE